jgi:hypothetical protein
VFLKRESCMEIDLIERWLPFLRILVSKTERKRGGLFSMKQSIEDRQLNYDVVTHPLSYTCKDTDSYKNSLHPFSELPFYFILFYFVYYLR